MSLNYGYPQYGQYYPQPQQSQQTTGGITWVQGEAGAKSYIVGAGATALLMDSEANCFYIKSTDASGMPMPLRTFDYAERKKQSEETEHFVTRREFEELAARINAMTAKEVQPDE